MLKAKKDLDKETDDQIKLSLIEQINDNDILSNVYKTFLNSIYGIFSQIYSPLFDIEHAESVTLTGQAVVKQGSQIIYEYAKSNGFTGPIEEICVYQDTDSEFFSFDTIFKNNKINLSNGGNIISDQAYSLIKEYGDVLNKEINEWAKKELKSIDSRYFFKREKICDVALLQAKKFYILHILDKEGNIPKDDEMFEYKGIEVAKSILSKEVKHLIKNIIESAILAKERKKAIRLFHNAYEKYCNMSPEEIASRKKVNNYQKYKTDYNDETGDFAKGTPHHVKSSINFNDALKKMNIDSKYPLIQNGTKMKHFYCKKNAYGYESIGFIDIYPKELLSVVAPNYKFMFEKNIIPVVSKIFKIIGWPIPAIGCEEYTDLNELFS
jgi:DNA polymerase elongation subunit (family B)